MSTGTSYYYYGSSSADYGSSSYSTYTSYPSTQGSFTYTTDNGEVDGSECLNYVYLVWVYFLFYIGAGYPSYYYPYIIATLLDTVPQECGGTAGENTGSGLDNSALSLLSLQQSYPFGGAGAGSGGVQIALSPGQSYAGYGSSGTGTNSLSAYGIQQPQVVVPQGYNYAGSGVQQGSLGSLGGFGRRRRRSIDARAKLSKVQQKKKYYSMKIIKSARDGLGKKTSSVDNKKQTKATKRKDARQYANIEKRKNVREKELGRSENKPKQRSSTDLRVMERKEERQLENIEDRTDIRKTDREKSKQKNVEKRIKTRKQTRSKNKKVNRNERKKKRKEKRKKVRKQKAMRIENSSLGKRIPKGKLQEFRTKYLRGRSKTKGYTSFKFLNNLDFPFSDTGSLRRDFRQLVKKKVINKLPDYCEEVKMEKLQKVKEDCKKRAKRIKERIVKRLGKNKNGVSKQNKSGNIRKIKTTPSTYKNPKAKAIMQKKRKIPQKKNHTVKKQKKKTQPKTKKKKVKTSKFNP